MIRFRKSEHLLRFKRPFVTSKWTLTERRVQYLIAMDEETGQLGFGESAPLEPFGTESYEDAYAALSLLCERVFPMPSSKDDLTAIIDRTVELRDKPTARFAAECALLDLLSKREKIPLHILINQHELPGTILINAVIGGNSPAETADRAEEAVRDGFTCLKLKVGIQSLNEDERRISEVRQRVGDNVLLRLDANGVWSLQQALTGLRAFQPYDIEYVEQPVHPNDIDALETLARERIIPVAADEAIRNAQDAHTLMDRRAADVLVLKPMAFGSLLACADTTREASLRGVDVVFTSLLDSAVGRAAVAHLAVAMKPFCHRHHGLATGGLFVDDPAPSKISRGLISLSTNPGLGLDAELPS